MPNILIRIFIYLIYILIVLFLPGRYRRGWGYLEYNRNYIYNYDLYGVIRNSIRHFLAIRKAKKYITQTTNCIYLENKKVKIFFNGKCYSLKCYNKENRGQSFKVYAVDRDPLSYNGEQTDETFFTDNFYDICYFFDEKSSYTGIKRYLEKNFKISEEKGAKGEVKSSKKFVAAPTVDEVEKVEIKEKIDINSAKEVDIAALPGINIALAKKIIKYRNLHNGFKNSDEFYEQTGIKPHFQVQLDDLITFNAVKSDKLIENNDDRIIDF